MDVSVEPPRRRPRFRRAEQAPAFQLTDRDVEILRQVARCRFLRSTHISRLVDAPHKKICERLTSLYHAGYLDRPRSQLEYHVRAAGNAHYVYGLGNRGAQLLIQHGGSENASVDWARKNQEASRQFLLHTLAIADVRVALTTACRVHGGVTLQESKLLIEGLPEATRADRNPWSWRVRIQHAGAVHEIGVVPDYVFALILPDGRRRPFMVECDRGTMPVERSTLAQTSMLRKILAYEGGRQQSVHTSRYGWMNFRVLIVTESQRRSDQMRELMRRSLALKSSPLFLFAVRPMLMQSDILSQSWHDASAGIHTLI
jgi:Replication-relaxation